MDDHRKLLGDLSFVSRTFEGGFKENPYVLDLDANLYIGPADHLPRDEHASLQAIFHFLHQTSRGPSQAREALTNRLVLLDIFGAFDSARTEKGPEEFQIVLFGTYDGEPLVALRDDELPGGPCGRSVNEIKRRLYDVCSRADREFHRRHLNSEQQLYEARFVLSVPKS